MIKIHKTYLHERPKAPRDAPARRLDDRRRLRRVLADAPPAEALEGAREALEARGRAGELLQVLADGAAPPPLLLAEAPAERAPPRPELAERGVAADVPHVGAGVEVGRRGAAAAQAQAQRVGGRRPLGVVVPEQPAVPDAVAAAPVAVQGLGVGGGHRSMAKGMIPLKTFRKVYGNTKRDQIESALFDAFMRAIHEERE